MPKEAVSPRDFRDSRERWLEQLNYYVDRARKSNDQIHKSDLKGDYFKLKQNEYNEFLSICESVLENKAIVNDETLIRLIKRAREIGLDRH